MQQSLGHWLSNMAETSLTVPFYTSVQFQTSAICYSSVLRLNDELSQFNNYLANLYCAKSMPHFSQVIFTLPLNEERDKPQPYATPKVNRVNALLSLSYEFQKILESSIVPHPSLHLAFHSPIPKSERKSPLEL